jgi:hypothetical protein
MGPRRHCISVVKLDVLQLREHLSTGDDDRHSSCPCGGRIATKLSGRSVRYTCTPGNVENRRDGSTAITTGHSGTRAGLRLALRSMPQQSPQGEYISSTQINGMDMIDVLSRRRPRSYQ